MKLTQYAYFAIYSPRVSAQEIEERVGVAPDRVVVKGSKQAEPPIPKEHGWQLRSGRPDASLSDQIEELHARLTPIENRIVALLGELGSDAGCVLQVVRELNDPSASESGDDLLGWGLSPAAVALLARLGALIDVDEYDASATAE